MIKMTKEQKALFDELTTLQQEVALNAISGMSDIDSYRNSSGKATSESAQRASASEILANHKVKPFIDSMKAVAVSDAIMSRTEMLELQTKIANIDSARIGSMTLEQLTELKGGLDIKLKAMKQLAELAGYDAPIKTEQSGEVVSISMSKEEYAETRKKMLDQDDC